jgi:prepilin-type N-terminal cleavage/methylation domain-containing protein
MKRVCDNRGVSLIEMVVAIVVVGLAIPALTRVWFDVTTRSSRSEAIADAAFYGGQLMEEISTKRFDEALNAPWTAKAQFGARRSDETDEITRPTYDDVDDFDGYNDTVQGYARVVTVNYANLTGSAWNTSAAEANFKQIAVRVSRRALAVSNVTMVTVVGQY